MLMGNNHASPVLQSVTEDTNYLIWGQRSLVVGSNVGYYKMGILANFYFGFFNFTVHS